MFSAGLNVTEVLANDGSYTAGLLDALHETLARPLPVPNADGGGGQRAGHRRWLSAGVRI